MTKKKKKQPQLHTTRLATREQIKDIQEKQGAEAEKYWNDWEETLFQNQELGEDGEKEQTNTLEQYYENKISQLEHDLNYEKRIGDMVETNRCFSDGARRAEDVSRAAKLALKEWQEENKKLHEKVKNLKLQLDTIAIAHQEEVGTEGYRHEAAKKEIERRWDKRLEKKDRLIGRLIKQIEEKDAMLAEQAESYEQATDEADDLTNLVPQLQDKIDRLEAEKLALGRDLSSKVAYIEQQKRTININSEMAVAREELIEVKSDTINTLESSLRQKTEEIVYQNKMINELTASFEEIKISECSEMTDLEVKNYQELSVTQKNMVDALKLIGLKYQYFSTYELEGWGKVNVAKCTRWSDLLQKVHQEGRTNEMYRIRKALGITG
jgi:hypothetical protein